MAGAIIALVIIIVVIFLVCGNKECKEGVGHGSPRSQKTSYGPSSGVKYVASPPVQPGPLAQPSMTQGAGVAVPPVGVQTSTITASTGTAAQAPMVTGQTGTVQAGTAQPTQAPVVPTTTQANAVGPTSNTQNKKVDIVIVQMKPKTEEHPFHGVGERNGYTLNGIQGADLTVHRGQTYRFQQQVADCPLYFTTSESGGATDTERLFGVDPFTGSTEVTIPMTIPEGKELYYQCASRPHVGGHLYVL